MANEDLFPKEFVERLKAQMPEARANIRLAERRLAVAKAAGGDTTAAEKRIFETAERLRKIRAAFGIV